MSDFANPYQSPRNESIPETTPGSGPALTEPMLRYLKEAAPWLRFIGILGFISVGITVLGGIGVTIDISLAGSESAYLLESLGAVGSMFGGILSFLGLFYIGAALLVFFPSLFLYRFGTGIRSYFQNNLAKDLETALKNNKSFWKFVGILTIISLASIPVLSILAIIVGAVLAAAGAF
jgi:hypothetical protein